MTTHTFMLQLCLHCINLSARLIFSSEWRRISFSAGFCVEIYKYIFHNTTKNGRFLAGFCVDICIQKIGDMRLGETRFRTCSMKSWRRTRRTAPQHSSSVELVLAWPGTWRAREVAGSAAVAPKRGGDEVRAPDLPSLESDPGAGAPLLLGAAR